MKKKKFITPKVRVIKLEAEELLAASGDPEQKARGVQADGFGNAGTSWWKNNNGVVTDSEE